MYAVRKTKDPIIEKVIKSAPQLPREADPFPVIEVEIFDSLPIQKFQIGEDRKKNRLKMIQEYNASVAILQQRMGEILSLLQAVVYCQVVIIGRVTSELNALCAEKYQAVLASLNAPQLQVLDILHAPLMARPDEEILETLKTALRTMSGQVVGQLKAVLLQLQEKNCAGEINWFSTDVCKYFYFKHQRMTRSTSGGFVRNSRVQEGNAWVTYEVVTHTVNVQKFDVLTRVEHHLFNATRFQFPALQLRWPKYLSQLQKSVPAWLAPHVFVTEGDMLRETFRNEVDEVSNDQYQHQTRREIGREEIWTGNNLSPAVSIGSIVIAGWAKADI